jgi:type IV pilus assembly protein PilB
MTPQWSAMFKNCWKQAVALKASDLHFEPYEHQYRVRMRIDGELREVASPHMALKDRLASRIKVMSRLDIAEKRLPQDGRMKLQLAQGRELDLRVSTLPTLFGEKLVIRVLDSAQAQLDLGLWATSPKTWSACWPRSVHHTAWCW